MNGLIVSSEVKSWLLNLILSWVNALIKWIDECSECELIDVRNSKDPFPKWNIEFKHKANKENNAEEDQKSSLKFHPAYYCRRELRELFLVLIESISKFVEIDGR